VPAHARNAIAAAGAKRRLSMRITFRSLQTEPGGKLRRETEPPRATLHAPLIQTRQRACHGHAASVWINNWPWKRGAQGRGQGTRDGRDRGPHFQHRSPSLIGFQLAVGPTRLPLKAGGAEAHGPDPSAQPSPARKRPTSSEWGPLTSAIEGPTRCGNTARAGLSRRAGCPRRSLERRAGLKGIRLQSRLFTDWSRQPRVMAATPIPVTTARSAVYDFA